MNRPVIPFLSLFSLLILLVLQIVFGSAPAIGQQQGGAGVVVHTVVAKDGQTDAGTNTKALELTVTYSLQRENGQAVLSEKEIQGSRLLFDAQRRLAVRDEPVEKGTWNIVLLTDLSSTSPSAFTELLAARKILAERLESGPTANYIWYDFADKLAPSRFEKFLPVKGGTSNDNDKDNLVKALTASKTSRGKVVCLNNVLLEAVQKVQQPAGKKAVLVLTHQGDTCNSASQLDALVRAATPINDPEHHVQIFAIGLGDLTLQAELDKITKPTGGAAFVKDVTAIGPAIEQTLSLMKGQREAVYLLHPDKAGEHAATLEVITANNISQSAEFTFTSKLAYTLPPSLSFVSRHSTQRELVLFFDCVSPEQLERVQIQLLTTDTRQIVHDQNYPGASLADKLVKGQCLIRVPGSKLEQKRSYVLRGLVKQPGQPPLPMAAEEKLPVVDFDPTPPKILIKGFSAPSPTSPQFVVTVTADIAATLVDVLLVRSNQGGQTEIASKQAQVPLGVEPKTIVFKADELPSGTYLARAEWTGSPEIGATSEALPFAPESYWEWLKRKANENSTSRLALIGLALAAVLGLLFLVWFIRSRSVSQLKIVPDELTPKQRMRQIQINPEPPSIRQPSAAPPVVAQPAKIENPQPSPNPKSSGLAPLVPAYIRVRKPSQINFKGRIKKTPFTIGRDSSNDGVLQVDGQSGVSRKKHVSLIFQNGQWHVRDEGTPNGTKLNGSRIAPNQLVPLGAQALLTLGQVEIEFQLDKAVPPN